MNKIGYRHGDGYSFTYQIGETPVSASSAGFNGSSATPIERLAAKKVDNYYVWPCGPDNLDFNTCKTLIKGNRLLPSLIEKQIAILYGTGPQLYISKIDQDGKVQRTYVQRADIQKWLDSWRENGLQDSYETYLNKCIRSYYYSEGIFSMLHLSRAHAAGLKNLSVPIVGLEHVTELRCRLATTKDISRATDVEDKDFRYVLVGNWEQASRASQFKVYPRLDFTKPLSKHCAISYSKNPNQGEDIYATNKFFKGIMHWIRGCNANPEYINSFLENSLSARHHVIIPNAWIRQKEEMLRNLCDINAQLKANGKKENEWHTVKIGGKVLEVGDVYTDDILAEYVQEEISNLANFLSGRGKNQGKIYASRSFYNDDGKEESWKIEEIPQKYKEYIEALIAYDKRADMVLLGAKGIDSSISNISQDGVISKSGADTYYNYMVYLTQQSIPESVVCADLNYAIKLNFPQAYAEGVRIGFYRPNVQRQEEIAPADRLSNQSEL